MSPQTITKSVSIIIPTFNEEAVIANTLKTLLAITDGSKEVEIIISDASSDRTPDLLKEFPVTVCRSEKGRAVQLNAGARMAKGEILYFLHADTLPPKTFLEDIRSAVEQGHKAGCFRMHFDDNHPIMSLYGWFTQFPLTLCRGGDQSLFMEHTLFREIGGFNETLRIMEDINIINRIEQRTRFHILESEVTTSARKYHKNGMIELQMSFGTLHLMYALGFDQESMTRFYKENIR